MVAERNSPVVERIKTFKVGHPFWGYRRIWAYLKYVDELEINKKRVLKLVKKHGLLVNPDTKLKATRTPPKSKPKSDRPNQWWGIDMTKVMVQRFGCMYIVSAGLVYQEACWGYYAGIQCRSKHWLEAPDAAVNKQFSGGVLGQRLFLMSNNGSQPTSIGFMRACRDIDISQAFTSYNNPRGKADTERVFRTMKEELLWPRDWTSPFELADSLGEWIECYNGSYLHSALGYKAPVKFEEEYQNS